jgi:hypothetical protein
MIAILQNIESETVISQIEKPTPMAVATPVPNVTGGSTAPVTFNSATINRTTGAANWNNWQITVDFGVTLENLTPSIGTLQPSNFLSKVADGIALIRATGSHVTSLRLPIVTVGAETVDTFGGWNSGSASKSVSDELEALWVEGKTKPLFTTKNDATGTYVKNSDCWANDLDLSGLAVAISYDGGATWVQDNASCAITARHMIGARHWGKNYSNAVVRFRGTDGSINERAVIGVSSALSAPDDLIVLALASPNLPETVAPFAVVGEWFRSGYSQVTTHIFDFWCGAYAFAVNQNYHALGMFIGNGTTLGKTFRTNGTGVGNFYMYVPCYGGDFGLVLGSDQLAGDENFFAPIVTGDSGKPTFLLNGGTPVLLGVFTTAYACTFVGSLDGDVANAHIASADSNAGVSTGLTVTVAPDPTL